MRSLPGVLPVARGFLWRAPDGRLTTLSRQEALERVGAQPVLTCHARALARRLGVPGIIAFDVLELFAFTRPARFAVPTVRGLAAKLERPLPEGTAAELEALPALAEALLAELAALPAEPRARAGAMAWFMGGIGAAQRDWVSDAGTRWLWAPAVLRACQLSHIPDRALLRDALELWRRLPEWPEFAPESPPGDRPISPEEARRQLTRLLAVPVAGKPVEPRPQQGDYASAVSHAFTPRQAEGMPQLVLAEAGTGVGKTLGYLAPATAWAEANGAPVWISTYTRNLQNQIDGELDRLYPDAERKAARVVVRKGRDNYLCLLNLEEATHAARANPAEAVAVGLMLRWADATRDGDLVGGDFPSWLADLAGRARTLGLADRRGECIHAACPHWRRCYIERSIRAARRADIVIANHALVLSQVAGADAPETMTRLVFDEGHHLFDAADSAFTLHLTGREMQEMRRWLLGPEGGSRNRARGVKRRLEELLGDNTEAWNWLNAVLAAARALPTEGWLARMLGEGPEPYGAEVPAVGDEPGGGSTVAEDFLWALRGHVRARATGRDGPYSLEAPVNDPGPELVAAAGALDTAFAKIEFPLTRLQKEMLERLETESDTLDSDTRRRLDGAARSLQRRAIDPVRAWRGMLGTLGEAPTQPVVDWSTLDRVAGREADIGLHRAWVDPTQPLAHAVAQRAHGVVMTSATLRDGTGNADLDWHGAEERTGAIHFPGDALRAQVPSPYDHAGQTQVLIVNDVNRDDPGQVAAAYRVLFEASGGGALGLFTAIARLRAVHERLAPALEQAEIPLLAQHLDGMDIASLIEIFRAEEDACLLGTDAVRDGMDVPGDALRLIVYDRVPWPRPDILHRARRERFGQRSFDDRIARLRLKQAYGRLVRRADDRGVFVMLDPAMPSRLFGAFPKGVEPQRVGLADAVASIRSFLGTRPMPKGMLDLR